MPLPLLAMAVGAGIGVGVGSYGYDNWGWSKDSIWKGAALLAGAGYAYGTYGAAAGTAMSSQAGPPAALATGGAGTGAATAGGGGGTGFFSAKSLAAPLLIGAAGMGIASAYGTQGSAFKENIALSPEGEQLQKDYLASVKGRMTKAKAGDVKARIAPETSKLKKAEDYRSRITEGVIGTGQAIVGNRPKEQRGGGVMGGQFAKAIISDTSERMTGLFAPTSLLNNSRKEELLNSSKHVRNLYNIDNQTAMFNYSSSLAKWGANQELASQKGAAIGGAVAMLGRAYSTSAYLNAMKIAG